MFWIKFGILIIGFIYAGILPYTVYKAIKSVGFDPQQKTLSHISIKGEYGSKYHRGYTYLMFATAILTYFFFWLLTEIYNLGEFDKIITYIDYSCGSLLILAFIPFNLVPYEKGNLWPNIKRIFHNILAVFVFLSLAALIILFNIALCDRYPLLSIIGFVIILITAVLLLLYMVKNSITGLSELIFINGLSTWSIFVTIFTILK